VEQRVTRQVQVAAAAGRGDVLGSQVEVGTAVGEHAPLPVGLDQTDDRAGRRAGHRAQREPDPGRGQLGHQPGSGCVVADAAG
jgi:hypothetical protein